MPVAMKDFMVPFALHTLSVLKARCVCRVFHPALLAAVAWPAALIGMASVIDNPWSVCTQRSMLAGRQLAEVLLSRQQVCVARQRVSQK